MTKIELVTQDSLPPHPIYLSPTPAGQSSVVMETTQPPSAKVYCWPSFFSPSVEPELLPLLPLSLSAAICRTETEHVHRKFITNNTGSRNELECNPQCNTSSNCD